MDDDINGKWAITLMVKGNPSQAINQGISEALNFIMN